MADIVFTATTGCAFFARAGDVDGEGAAAHILAVHAGDGLLRLGIELMVTKAKPRERLVMRSITMLVFVTLPNAAKASCRSFSVVSKERFPTNSLLFI